MSNLKIESVVQDILTDNTSSDEWQIYASNFQGKCPPSRQITTKYGIIEGRKLIFEGEKQVEAFQGIPYARPPVGELRFKRPEPPLPWEGIKQTKQFGPRSIQKDDAGTWRYNATSEDCLSLNVFSPVWEPVQKSGFAVIVYIHGGGFVTSGALKFGDIGICENLVTKDVIVVTIQYRLGYLGFFSTGDDVCPGNNGLWDMTLALDWIKENISAFNGDPNNVTVMGQSAGGAAADILSLSPHSRDLCHKVIAMAGNADASWAIGEDITRNSRKKAKEIGVERSLDSNKFLSDLRAVDAMKFACGIGEALDDDIRITVGPRYDGDFLPKTIEELRKEAHSIPRMYGACEKEGMLLIKPIGSKDFTISRVYAAVETMFTEREYPKHFDEYRKKVMELSGITEETADGDLRKPLSNILGDPFIFVANQKIACEYAKMDSPVYLYSFDYCNPDSFGPVTKLLPFVAATHCCEIPYILAASVMFPFKMNEKDRKILDITTTMWTNFAKFGNPNGPSDSSDLSDMTGDIFHWEKATKVNPQRHLIINEKMEMKDEYHNGRPMKILDLYKSKNRT